MGFFVLRKGSDAATEAGGGENSLQQIPQMCKIGLGAPDGQCYSIPGSKTTPRKVFRRLHPLLSLGVFEGLHKGVLDRSCPDIA